MDYARNFSEVTKIVCNLLAQTAVKPSEGQSALLTRTDSLEINMNKINMLIFGVCAMTAIGAASLNLAAATDDKMMMKDDSTAMEKKGAMMEKSPAMEKAHKGHEVAFTSSAFVEAQASGEPFLIAFHKKGCPVCASQKQALNEVYANPK